MRKIFFLILFFLPFVVYSQHRSINDLLINAIVNNNKDSVALLLRQGANPNYENEYGVTPLMFAVENANYDIISLLLNKGADIDKVPRYDPPVLSFAVMSYKDSVLSLLLDRGANPDIADYSGRTPLYYSIIYGNLYAADQLLFYGANPDTIILGWTPLELASYYDDTVMVNMLIYYGADVNRQDDTGFTALHVAAQYDRLMSAKTLMAKGARIDILDDNLASPVDIAVYQRSYPTQEFLLKRQPSFDNFINQTFDTYQLSILAQNYKAKKALKKIGIGHKFFALDYIISVNQSLGWSDYFIGLGVGLKELNTNMEWQLGFDKRIFDKRVMFENGENSYLQLWERRWSAFSELDKNFCIGSSGRVNHYLGLGLKAMVSYADYHGSFRTSTDRFLSPVLIYSIDYYRFMSGLKFYYMPMPYIQKVPIYMNFFLAYRLPATYHLTIGLKKKSPVVYGRNF